MSTEAKGRPIMHQQVQRASCHADVMREINALCDYAGVPRDLAARMKGDDHGE